LITAFWMVTVSLKHQTADWSSFRQGYLKLAPFAKPSWFNPHCVAQIYLFENPQLKDNVFMEDLPSWLLQFALGNIAMFVLTLLPNRASIFFFLGGGPILSMNALALLAVVCLVVCIFCYIVVAAKTVVATISGWIIKAA